MDFFSFIIDFVLHIDKHLVELTALYGPWIYGILFLILFCETGLVVTPFLPGDSLLFVAGSIAAMTGSSLNVHLLFLILSSAAILGDSVNFFLGRKFGKKVFSNPNSKIFKQVYLEKTKRFYDKHGGKTIILARFVPIVRTFAPFVAGMGDMKYHFFIFSNVFGGILWVSLFLYAGYFLGSLPFIQNNLHLLMLGIIVVSILPAIIGVLREKTARKADVNQKA